MESNASATSPKPSADENHPNITAAGDGATNKPSPTRSPLKKKTKGRKFSATPCKGSTVNPYAAEGSERRYSVPIDDVHPAPGDGKVGIVEAAEDDRKPAALPNVPSVPRISSSSASSTAAGTAWRFGAGNIQTRVKVNDNGVAVDLDVPAPSVDEDDLPIMDMYNRQRGRYAIAADVLADPVKSFVYRNRKYNKHNNLKNGWASYRCSQYRNGCGARLNLHLNGEVAVKNDEHNDPQCAQSNFHPNSISGAGGNGNVIDVTEEMKRYVDFEAITHATTLPNDIASACMNEFDLRYDGQRYTGLSRQQIVTRVGNTRRTNNASGAERQVETEHMASGRDSFCRTQHTWIDPKHPHEKQKLITFSKPELMARAMEEGMQGVSKCCAYLKLFLLMRTTSSLFSQFLDGTFSLTPRPFYQTLVFMIYDRVNEIYLPVYWATVTGKTESCYRAFLLAMKEDLKGKFNPSTIGVDFESALINAVKEVFPNAKLIGCTFHFKQAIRRKMLELGIPKDIVSYCMIPGMVDLLTVLPPKDIRTIDSKGVLYVAMLIESSTSTVVVEDEKKMCISDWVNSEVGAAKMKKFWSYMDK